MMFVICRPEASVAVGSVHVAWVAETPGTVTVHVGQPTIFTGTIM